MTIAPVTVTHMRNTEDGVQLLNGEEIVMFLPHWLLEQIIKNAYEVQANGTRYPITYH